MTKLDITASPIRSQMRLILSALAEGHVLCPGYGISIAFRQSGDRMPGPEQIVTDMTHVFVRSPVAYWTPLCSLDNLADVLPAYFESEEQLRAYILRFEPIGSHELDRDVDIPVVYDDDGVYELAFSHYPGTDRLAVFQVDAVTGRMLREVSSDALRISIFDSHQFLVQKSVARDVDQLRVSRLPAVFARVVDGAGGPNHHVYEVAPAYVPAFERIMAEHVANGMGTTQIMADEMAGATP